MFQKSVSKTQTHERFFFFKYCVVFHWNTQKKNFLKKSCTIPRYSKHVGHSTVKSSEKRRQLWKCTELLWNSNKIIIQLLYCLPKHSRGISALSLFVSPCSSLISSCCSKFIFPDLILPFCFVVFLPFKIAFPLSFPFFLTFFFFPFFRLQFQTRRQIALMKEDVAFRWSVCLKYRF